MPITVPQIKADVKLKFNGISDADFLMFLNEGHAKICKRVQLYPQSSAFIVWTAGDVTAGRGEWSLPVKVKRGWQARYWSSATSSTRLEPTNIHRLDSLNEEWRTADAGMPTEWYESGGSIGLYPKPSTNPSSGYPKVEIYNTGFEELAADDSLPEQVDDPTAWSCYVKYRYATSRDEAAALGFMKLHRMALKELSDDIDALNPRDKKEIHPYVPSVVNL